MHIVRLEALHSHTCKEYLCSIIKLAKTSHKQMCWKWMISANICIAFCGCRFRAGNLISYLDKTPNYNCTHGLHLFLITWIYMTTGFNGRGVLPGVATGNGLKPKSGKLSIKMTSVIAVWYFWQLTIQYLYDWLNVSHSCWWSWAGSGTRCWLVHEQTATTLNRIMISGKCGRWIF